MPSLLKMNLEHTQFTREIESMSFLSGQPEVTGHIVMLLPMWLQLHFLEPNSGGPNPLISPLDQLCFFGATQPVETRATPGPCGTFLQISILFCILLT